MKGAHPQLKLQATFVQIAVQIALGVRNQYLFTVD